MTTYPKSTGDELPAVDWNIVAAQADDALKPAGNLAGLEDVADARDNLGLGDSATRDVGTGAGTVAAGDDSRITGAAQKASNLSDLASASTARTNLGLAVVAASGDYTDLDSKPVVENDADPGFVVADTGGEIALRINEAGETEIATLVNGGATTTTATAPGVAWGVGDGYGNIALQVGTDGKAGVPGMTFGTAPAGYALVIADAFGNIGGAIDDEGVGSGFFGGGGGSGSSPTTYSADEQARRGARALALSAAVLAQTNTTAARPVWKYNHVLAYGQSLSTGWEGWPRLSATQPFDNLMVGDSDHPQSETSSAWVQFGSAAFNPLVATVESGGALADAATVAAYSAGNSARGESPVVGATNFWRKQQLAHRGLASDSSRLLAASSCGVGGKTIAQLSSGASPNLFNRLIDCAEVAKSIADGASATYGIAAALFLQGESDALDAGTSAATYKATLATLQQDFHDDVTVAIAGQSTPVAWFTYQTSQAYVRDSNALAVSQAQLEAAQEFDNWYMVGPSYPVTDKSSFHLDPNGYRWLGMQFGKVMHQVLDLGRGWMPLHPIRATWRGVQVLVDFHVPHPPLQFQPAYVSTTATTYAAKGFKVTDDSGTLTISSVEIVSDACVLITLASTPGTNPYLWYGGQSPSAGNGNLCDSDPTIASDVYEYTAGTGQYAGAEIAALVDEPYPLWNWCVLFRMAIEYDPPA